MCDCAFPYFVSEEDVFSVALETKTTSFQRPYPGLAGVVLSFPFVISGEGQASLKPRLGQGGSLVGGFEQKLKVAPWLLPTTRRGCGSAFPAQPGPHLQMLAHEERGDSGIPALREVCTFPAPPPLRASPPPGLRRGCPRNLAARPEATQLSGFRGEF